MITAVSSGFFINRRCTRIYFVIDVLYIYQVYCHCVYNDRNNKFTGFHIVYIYFIALRIINIDFFFLEINA
jgi:hypothetical protein